MNIFFTSSIVKTTSIIILLGFFIRLLAVLYGYTFGPLFGADLDAVTYHTYAAQYAETNPFDDGKVFVDDLAVYQGPTTLLYIQILGTVYYIFSASLVVGGIFSSLIWLLSAIYLNKSLHLLKFDLKSKILVNITYSFIPSSIIFTSTTIREPIYLLIVNLILYLFLNIFFNRKKTLSLFFLILVLLFGQQLHFAMYLYLYVVMVIICLYYLNIKTRFSKSLIFFVFFVSVAIFAASKLDIIYQYINEWKTYIQNFDAIEARSRYSFYKDNLLILDLLTGLVNYLFRPLIWEISNVADIVAFSENLIRFIIVFNFLKRIYRKNISSIYAILVLMYLSLEFFWSLGTTNWGTAMRHHIPTLGIMIILFAYSGFAKIRLIRRK